MACFRPIARLVSDAPALFSVALAVVLILSLTLVPVARGYAADDPIRVRIDGRELSTDPAPFIADGRTLIPLRAIFEALGATVDWNESARRVTARRGQRTAVLQVDQRLACLDAGCRSAQLLDVPARIHQDRTFVPLRFAASALGAAVRWDGATRTVHIDTAAGGPADTTAGVRITAPAPGQTITGPAGVQAWLAPEVASRAAEIRFLLLSPQTGRGPVVARGADPAGAYTWLPDPAHDGLRLLAAAAYDARGRFLAGDVVPVQVAVRPQVVLRASPSGQPVDARLDLAVDLSFVATHVRYERLDPATGQWQALADADPYGPFTWWPTPAQNGSVTLRAQAFDRLGRAHASNTVQVQVQVPLRLSLSGVTAGNTLTRPRTLSARANFPVSEVRYLLRDPDGGESVLAAVPGGGGFRWVPSPAQNGHRELLVEAVDAAGQVLRSAPVPVEVDAAPAVFLETVGPNQVLAGEVNLRAVSSVPLTGIEYQLIDPATGAARRIAGGSDPAAAYAWTPAASDAGAWRLRAVGQAADGTRIASEDVPVRVYTGKTYGPHVAVPKDRFIDVTGRLAVDAYGRTGMSAALQVAQAILESGWGQYAPADKYSGRPSFNLFGIKGRGPAGSVTSNTWEEYYGVVYRIDAQFRAYGGVEESWQDHKRLLLGADRYAPFRAVMHDPVRAAWALRRAGYATDSQYPVKLIRLMSQHDLFRLDETSP